MVPNRLDKIIVEAPKTHILFPDSGQQKSFSNCRTKIKNNESWLRKGQSSKTKYSSMISVYGSRGDTHSLLHLSVSGKQRTEQESLVNVYLFGFPAGNMTLTSLSGSVISIIEHQFYLQVCVNLI